MEGLTATAGEIVAGLDNEAWVVDMRGLVEPGEPADLGEVAVDVVDAEAAGGGWRFDLVGQGEVALVLLGEVEAQDGVQAVEEPAQFDQVVGVGRPASMSSRSRPRRRIWWAISTWARLIVPVGSAPPSTRASTG